MDVDFARKLLSDAGQSHVLAFWESLDADGRARLLAQVSAIDFADLAQLRETLASGDSAARSTPEPIEPAPVSVLEGEARAAAVACGEAELRAGRVGVLIVAGGQGTRLGFSGPKGCYPIGPVTNASLFHFHARKVLALRRAYGRPVPLYIMTSGANEAATRAHFAENRFFGLPEEDVRFFSQGMWPALLPDGRLVLDRPDNIFLSPDGHGGVLAALDRSGALADMEARGLSSICYLQVDNPMVDIADPVFVGFHVGEGADVTLKACLRRGPGEKMGMPVLRGGRTAIVEYTEFSEEQMHERGPDGGLRFRWGAPSPYMFSMPFLRREAVAGLPIHLAHKKVPYIDDNGVLVKPESPNAYKFEKFVFDALADARVCACLAFDREEEYSPVKNAEGEKSPAACRGDLSRKWARWLAECGVDVPLDERGYPLHPIEIDPAYAHSVDALKSRLAATDAPSINPAADILLLSAEANI